MKRICGKVDEMHKQRISFEKELRDLIQKDDITTILVTTERSEIKVWSVGPTVSFNNVYLAFDKNLWQCLTLGLD